MMSIRYTHPLSQAPALFGLYEACRYSQMQSLAMPSAPALVSCSAKSEGRNSSSLQGNGCKRDKTDRQVDSKHLVANLYRVYMTRWNIRLQEPSVYWSDLPRMLSASSRLFLSSYTQFVFCLIGWLLTYNPPNWWRVSGRVANTHLSILHSWRKRDCRHFVQD